MILRQVTYRVCRVRVRLGGGRRGGEGTCRHGGAEAGGYDKKEDNHHAKTPHASKMHAISVRADAAGSRIDDNISCYCVLRRPCGRRTTCGVTHRVHGAS